MSVLHDILLGCGKEMENKFYEESAMNCERWTSPTQQVNYHFLSFTSCLLMFLAYTVETEQSRKNHTTHTGSRSATLYVWGNRHDGPLNYSKLVKQGNEASQMYVLAFSNYPFVSGAEYTSKLHIYRNQNNFNFRKSNWKSFANVCPKREFTVSLKLSHWRHWGV
jgi:hypothetical protein